MFAKWPSQTKPSEKFVITKKQTMFGVEIDAIDMREAIETVKTWVASPETGCRFVVTPNVDHAVLLQQQDALRAAYEDAGLILADGHPIVWASRLLGTPLPERVPGSDLVPRLFDAVDKGEILRVFLLGAMPGVGEVAASNIRLHWPRVEPVGVYSPPFGFENDAQECDEILQKISAAHPDVVIVGLGAPKQELWVHKHLERIDAKCALCVGATIDFLAGEKKRAPRWMQKSGIEWLHRMCSEPKRLVKRYAKDAWIFPQLVFRQWLANRRQAHLN